MTMTPEQAAERLARMTAASTAPELTDDDLAALLADAAREDARGNGPTVDGWEPTYDFNWAAAEGWRMKAGAAAALYAVTADGAGFQRNQVFEHCERMAAHYAARVTSDALADRDRDLILYEAGELLP